MRKSIFTFLLVFCEFPRSNEPRKQGVFGLFARPTPFSHNTSEKSEPAHDGVNTLMRNGQLQSQLKSHALVISQREAFTSRLYGRPKAPVGKYLEKSRSTDFLRWPADVAAKYFIEIYIRIHVYESFGKFEWNSSDDGDDLWRWEEGFGA